MHQIFFYFFFYKKEHVFLANKIRFFVKFFFNDLCTTTDLARFCYWDATQTMYFWPFPGYLFRKNNFGFDTKLIRVETVTAISYCHSNRLKVVQGHDFGMRRYVSHDLNEKQEKLLFLDAPRL